MQGHFRTVFLAFSVVFAAALLPGAGVAAETPRAIIHTSAGDITLELYPDKAPATVQNFINYARSGFYDGTIFHRVISSFMIQGGGFTPEMQRKPTGNPIPNESDNGLSNERGTIAMARTGAPHSATAQFFINVENNTQLDFKGSADQPQWGYAVFGRVVDGMDVADDIRIVQTASRPPFNDVPVVPVIIRSVEIVGADPAQ